MSLRRGGSSPLTDIIKLRKMQIIDDFMPEQWHRQLCENVIDNPYFPWFDNRVLRQDNAVEDKINQHFCHLLYKEREVKSHDFAFFVPLFEQLNVDMIYRSQLNLTTCTSEIREFGYHIDNPLDNDYMKYCKTAVYYINTCDGYTGFEDGRRVDSVANRLLLFPSDVMHTSTTTTSHRSRYVININYFGGELAQR